MRHEQPCWAVLTPKDWEDGDELRPYGNGAQYQYPIFHTRKEAQSWKAEASWDRGRIVKAIIQIREGEK